ncbi:hypothetical protein [Dictyobacter kobayashii]|uniref:MalT-like TPR region domain-containing protein n=1 Tax=Dictyobacter kobayashii TaxID=2014872 RepID=A0A402AV81_9CHLR|nr:hypothetical protein [Dictyobacter kobayashii]GCE23041.1 hypothetical protein KDK_68410 [Dictyobacter kobayashii]
MSLFFPLHQVIILLPLASKCLIIGLAVLFAASLVYRRRLHAHSAMSRKRDYLLQSVASLHASDFRLMHYVQDIYLSRQVDRVVRETLRELAAATNRSLLGVCIVGPPLQGKTRLAWEAMRAELADWTVVRWPHVCYRALAPFDFSSGIERRFVLWLDDVYEFAHPDEANAILDFIRLCSIHDVHLIVIATCQDGELQRQAEHYLDSLLGRLKTVILPPMDQCEQRELLYSFSEQGDAVYGDEVDGAPGLLVLRIKCMRERYLHLPCEARYVLQALKLLHSAHIYLYSDTQVKTIVQYVFGCQYANWSDIYAVLEQEHFIVRRTGDRDAGDIIEPVANSYIGDDVIMDFPARQVPLTYYWIQLKNSFKQHADIKGLNYLGLAFATCPQENPLHNLFQAEACYRNALQLCSKRSMPYYWANIQGNLGDVFQAQAAMFAGVEGRFLVQRAITAYHDALTVYSPTGSPIAWAKTLSRLGRLSQAQARVMKGDESYCLLGNALQTYEETMVVYTREHTPIDWAMTLNDMGLTLHSQAQLREGFICYQLLQQALSTYQDALMVYIDNHAFRYRAQIQRNLGNILCDQAKLAIGEEQSSLLDRALAAYQDALTY